MPGHWPKHDILIDSAESASETIRRTILSNCSCYHRLEMILHGSNLKISDPVSMRRQKHITRPHDGILSK